jgi:hypothetical protein
LLIDALTTETADRYVRHWIDDTGQLIDTGAVVLDTDEDQPGRKADFPRSYQLQMLLAERLRETFGIQGEPAAAAAILAPFTRAVCAQLIDWPTIADRLLKRFELDYVPSEAKKTQADA